MGLRDTGLLFGLVGSDVRLTRDGTVATRRGSSWQSAMCTAEMRAGVHYAEFTRGAGSSVMVGVCTSQFHPRHGPAKESAQAWLIDADGDLRHAGNFTSGVSLGGYREGDVVGLLLDLTTGSLTVYKDGRRIGVDPDP